MGVEGHSRPDTDDARRTLLNGRRDARAKHVTDDEAPL